jgi:hypothetical protein
VPCAGMRWFASSRFLLTNAQASQLLWDSGTPNTATSFGQPVSGLYRCFVCAVRASTWRHSPTELACAGQDDGKDAQAEFFSPVQPTVSSVRSSSRRSPGLSLTASATGERSFAAEHRLVSATGYPVRSRAANVDVSSAPESIRADAEVTGAESTLVRYYIVCKVCLSGRANFRLGVVAACSTRKHALLPSGCLCEGAARVY